ncbi:MAG TPA: DUF2127 domain-containing protein [Verrucomicrobiae bacterium]|nr:DUF2127 domain-containing protein [Verrucomicrobiae bacterium]
MKKSERRMLRAIGLFKLAKAVFLVIFGTAALKLVNTDFAATLASFVPRLGVGPASHYVGRAVIKAASLTPSRIYDVALGSFIYAALFVTEGTGLLLLKRWAEWMTIIITSSLIPVEIWECFRHPHWTKFLLLAVNLALVGYLIYEVRRSDEVVASSRPSPEVNTSQVR